MANENQARVIAAKVRVPIATGLSRERLDARLAELWDHRFGLVVGPAGSGKTTLLSQFAAASGVATGWYRAEQGDDDEATVLRHVRRALGDVVPVGPEWARVEDACEALDAMRGTRLLVVVDDFHVLRGTEAEAAVERLVRYCPPGVGFLIASRVLPDFNLPLLRVSGALLELDADDLRFRSWEVERLFKDVYDHPLPPEDLARLTHETGGWAAVLQLFHLATRGKTPHEGRRVLGALRNQSRVVRDYLTRNVLDELPAALRDFLFDTCVLGRLSGVLCDQLRGTSDSAAMLDELSRRQVFVQAEDDGTYRYHDVLSGFLEATLASQMGEPATRDRYRRAGELLEDARALSDALRAYARAEDWPSVARVLGRDGEGATQALGAWIDLLPATLVDHDGWLALALARRYRAAGEWQRAIDAYRRAEDAFGSPTASHACRAERQAIATWLDPNAAAPATWWGAIRSAVTRDPLDAARDAANLTGGNARFAQGVALLLAGRIREARRALDAALHANDASPVLEVGAWFALAVAALLAGDEDAHALIGACAEQAERIDVAWLAMAVQSLAGHPGERASADDAASDLWTACLRGLLAGVGSLSDGEPDAGALGAAADGCKLLGAQTLEAWCRCLLALAAVDDGAPSARSLALEADALARAVGVSAPRAFALVALARTDPEHAASHRQLAQTIAAECGIALPTAEERGAGRAGNEVRCLGGFELSVDGVVVDLSTLRPRARSLLKLLAVHAGRWVHREAIVEALWPEATAEAGVRNLHVAVSSLRQVLGASGERPLSLIQREGDAYRFCVLPTDCIDLTEFDGATRDVAAAADRTDAAACIDALDRVSDLYRGDLLPEEGPAEWVVDERSRYRLAAVEAVGRAATCLVNAGESERAAKVCRHGLSLDRYADPLWRTLLAAMEATGDDAGAAVARNQYCAVLRELGVDAPDRGHAGAVGLASAT